MDTSKEYIKMCEKATEIQEVWKPKSGDYIKRTHTIFGKELDEKILETTDDIIILVQNSEVGSYWHATDENGETKIYDSNEDITKCTSLLLPRQDQLQEMVSEHSKVGLDLCNLYSWYEQTRPFDVADEYDSFEQLWLAFVMKEKYQKEWNGEEWKLIEQS